MDCVRYVYAIQRWYRRPSNSNSNSCRCHGQWWYIGETIFVILCAKSIILGRPPFSKGHIAWIRYKTPLSTSFEVLVVLAYPTCTTLAMVNNHLKNQNVPICPSAALHHEMVSSCRVNGENLVSVSICLYMEHANAQKKQHHSTSSRHPLHMAPLAIRHPGPYPIECNKRFSPAHTHAKEQTHFSCFSAEQKGHIGWWRRP